MNNVQKDLIQINWEYLVNETGGICRDCEFQKSPKFDGFVNFSPWKIAPMKKWLAQGGKPLARAFQRWAIDFSTQNIFGARGVWSAKKLNYSLVISMIRFSKFTFFMIECFSWVWVNFWEWDASLVFILNCHIWSFVAKIAKNSCFSRFWGHLWGGRCDGNSSNFFFWTRNVTP